MNLRRLSAVTRTHLLVGAVAACLSGWAWGPRGLAAAVAGVALGLANLWAIQRLAARAVFAAEAGTPSAAGRLAAGLLLKMAGLFVVAWLAIRVLDLGVLPFALGFSALVVALVISGERSFTREEAR